MGIIRNNAIGILNRVKVKLYPNYLPNVEGKYIAKTTCPSSLSIEKICRTMKDRGGFTGSHEDLIGHVRHFLDESMYQLVNGFSVNFGYFSIHPNIRGTFNSVRETYDRQKNPVDFKFRTLAPLSRLIEHIVIELDGMAETDACIDDFIDRDTDSVNALFAPGNMFTVLGNKIKFDDQDPECGLFFVPSDDPSQAVKATRIAENHPTMITGIVPETAHRVNYIEIRTRFSGSKTPLKNPRIIKSVFTIEAA